MPSANAPFFVRDVFRDRGSAPWRVSAADGNRVFRDEGYRPSNNVFLAILLAVATLAPPELEKAIAGLGDPSRRQAAEAQLVAFGPPVVPQLVKAADGQPEQVQEAIVDVLVRIGPDGLPQLARSEVPFRRYEFSAVDFAMRAVVRLSDDILPQLEAWAAEGRYADDHSFAMRSLATMGPARALPVLERLAKHPDERVRESALNIMVSWKDPMVADSLLRAINSSDAWLRRQAVQGLGMLRDPRVIEPALHYLEGDPSWSVQEVSALALGGQYETRFRVPLVKALGPRR